MKRYIKSSTQSGLVGIWWIYNNTVIGYSETLDNGYNDGSYIQYHETQNHMNCWSNILKEVLSDEAEVLIPQGYKSLERGRVIYNLRTMCYEITCSNEVAKNYELIQLIKDYYHLNNCRCDIVPLNQYHIAKITGNPELDRFEYGV